MNIFKKMYLNLKTIVKTKAQPTEKDVSAPAPNEFLLSTAEVLITKEPYTDFKNWSNHKLFHIASITTDSINKCKLFIGMIEQELEDDFKEGDNVYFNFKMSLYNMEEGLITEDIFFTSVKTKEFNGYNTEYVFSFDYSENGKHTSDNDLEMNVVKHKIKS